MPIRKKSHWIPASWGQPVRIADKPLVPLPTGVQEPSVLALNKQGSISKGVIQDNHWYGIVHLLKNQGDVLVPCEYLIAEENYNASYAQFYILRSRLITDGTTCREGIKQLDGMYDSDSGSSDATDWHALLIELGNLVKDIENVDNEERIDELMTLLQISSLDIDTSPYTAEEKEELARSSGKAKHYNHLGLAPDVRRQ